MTDICRLCASLKILDQLTSIAEPNLRLTEKLSRCCSVELSANELMPQSICHECVLSIDSSWNFAEKVCQAQDILKKAFIIRSANNDDPDEPANSFSGTISRYKLEVSYSDTIIHIPLCNQRSVVAVSNVYRRIIIEGTEYDHIVAHEGIHQLRYWAEIEYKCEAVVYMRNKKLLAKRSPSFR